MSYNIYKSDGSTVTIPNNAIDQTFNNAGANAGKGVGLQIVGSGSLNYVPPTAQNFLQLTENYCGTIMPPDSSAMQGQLWFNKVSGTDGILYVRNSASLLGGLANWREILVGNTTVTPGNYTSANITVNAQGRITSASNGSGGGGSGTVTSVSVVTANGVSGVVATPTVTPAITLSLGAITPTSVAASGTVTGSNLSGVNTGNQTITLTGAVTGSGTGSFPTSLFWPIQVPGGALMQSAPDGGLVITGTTNTTGTPTALGSIDIIGNSYQVSYPNASTMYAGQTRLDILPPQRFSSLGVSQFSGNQISLSGPYLQYLNATSDIRATPSRITSGGSTLSINETTGAFVSSNTSNINITAGYINSATIPPTVNTPLGQGGSIILNSGPGATGSQNGSISFVIGYGPGVTTHNLTITGNSAISINGNVGTVGQVLTSNGPSLPVTWTTVSGSGGGTVTSVGATGNQGVTVSGSPITGAGTINIGLGAITPTSVAASGTVTGSNLSGINTGNQTITLTGDVTGFGTGSFPTALSVTGVVPGSYTSANVTVDAKGRITSISNGSGGGGGTVTSVSVVSANGISGLIANATTTPAITLSLGNITPNNVTATGTITGINLSGTNTGNQTITLTGDVTGSGTGSFPTTLSIARNTAGVTSASLLAGATGNSTITGFKGYVLYKIQTSAAAWVRIYTSVAARTADSSRVQGQDPSPGSGVIAEAITIGAQTVLASPGVYGFNDELVPNTSIPIAVKNNSGSTTMITVTLTVLKTEG